MGTSAGSWREGRVAGTQPARWCGVQASLIAVQPKASGSLPHSWGIMEMRQEGGYCRIFRRSLPCYLAFVLLYDYLKKKKEEKTLLSKGGGEESK